MCNGRAAWNNCPAHLQFFSMARTIPLPRASWLHFGKRVWLIYGAMRDKAVDEIAGLLFPRAHEVFLTEPRQSRAISAPLLAEMTSHLARRFQVVSDPATAFEVAISSAAAEDAIFVTGSLYLVGELRRHWYDLDKNTIATSLDHAKH